MYQKILIAIDLSEDKDLVEFSIKQGKRFQEKFGSKLSFIYVIPSSTIELVKDFLPKELSGQERHDFYRNKFREIIRGIFGSEENEDILLEIREGVIDEEIRKYSNEMNIDLIIISDQINRHNKEYKLGSNTYKLVRNSDISVLVARELIKLNINDERNIFSGPAGRIEAKYYKQVNIKAPVALVLHPHPQYGKDMDNSVICNICDNLIKNGFTTLKINFRGVGKSVGIFDNGIGEIVDAATALDWLESENPESIYHLVAGFSFGSWVAMQLVMRRPEVNHFIIASPPVDKYDFSFLSPCPTSGLVLQGNRDSVISEDKVNSFVQKLNSYQNIHIEYEVIEGGDHFFRKKEEQLSKTIKQYLDHLVKSQLNNGDGEKAQVYNSHDKKTNDDDTIYI